MSMTNAEQIAFDHAFYVKLGAGGAWADDSMRNDLIRFGWSGIPLTEIHAQDWPSIRRRLAKEHSNKGTVTSDTKRLRDLATASSRDIWITFHRSHLCWGRMTDGPVEEDAISKFRRLMQPWSQSDALGRPLLANQIPGRIAQLQGFRGTVCSVRDGDALKRLLNGENSPAFIDVQERRTALAAAVVPAIQQLHWKDFETLVDLIFREAGWRRRSVLGETMKFADLELEEPMTGDRYQVQVKSRADIADLRTYTEEFSSADFRRLYFVVHSPTAALELASLSERVELILPQRLAEMVVDHGLLGWLSDRIR